MIDETVEVRSEGVTWQEIRDFCQVFELDFVRMGRPEDWDDHEFFRAHHASWGDVGESVSLDRVRQWMREEIRILSFIQDDEVRANMPLPDNWTNDQVEELDAFLRANGVLSEVQDIVVTTLPKGR